MDEAFRAESSDEEEFGETAPMLQRENSAALNAKLSFELPGQSGLQVSIPCWSLVSDPPSHPGDNSTPHVRYGACLR